MNRVALVGSGFDDLEPEGTTLARAELQLLVVSPDDLSPLAADGDPPRLVVIDTRSVGDRMPEIVQAVRAAPGKPSPAVVLVVPGLDREQWERYDADGLLTRPLTAARLLDAVRRHIPMEERGADRSEQVVKVQLASSTAEWTGFTRDLGATGIFVQGPVPFAEGDEVSARFALPGEPGGDPFQSTASVVRVERDGAGTVHGAALRFSGLTASDRGRLTRWLREKGKGGA